MRRNFWTCAGLIVLFSTLLFVTACQQKRVEPKPPEAPIVEPEQAPAEEPIQETTTVDDYVEPAPEPAAEPAPDPEKIAFVEENLYFNFDDDSLTPASQELLRKKAQWLRANPDVSVLIEGHCDERGTTEYNIALGDRRAESARAFLIDLGISASRMTKISYGEEMPADPGHNEAAWSKNRRAHFTIE